MNATDKKEELYLYLGLQIGFVKPIEQVLENLKEGVYEYGSNEAMNVLNEKLQNLTNCLLTALKINVKCPKIEGTFTKEYLIKRPEQGAKRLNILAITLKPISK